MILTKKRSTYELQKTLQKAKNESNKLISEDAGDKTDSNNTISIVKSWVQVRKQSLKQFCNEQESIYNKILYFFYNIFYKKLVAMHMRIIYCIS